MTKKLQIFSFPDKNPEYLQLQIDSYERHMRSEDVEFVVINSSTNFGDEIKSICNKNKIKHIEYTGKRNVPWSHYYVEQLNWFVKEVQSKTNDHIMLIHSDMFFINKIDHISMLKDKKIYFNPQYRNNNRGYTPPEGYDFFYMWDGVLLFDSEHFNSNNLTHLFNWDYLPVSDVGGQTYKLVENLTKGDFGFFEFWNLTDLKDGIFDTHLNGHVRALVDPSLEEIKIFENGVPKKDSYKGSSLFRYEIKKENYGKYFSEKISECFNEHIKNFQFPEPYSVDIIQIAEEDIKKAFIVHLKSGSRSHDAAYLSSKIKAIRNLVYRS